MKKRHIKILSWIIVGLLVCGVIIAYRYQGTATAPTGAQKSDIPGARRGGPVQVSVQLPELVLLSEEVPWVGILLPNEEVDISGEIAGKVMTVGFDEGKFVRKGSVLAKIDDRDLIAQLKRSKFQLKMLHGKLERQRILLEQDVISRESFDQIETDYNMVAADIELLKVKIDRTEIKAPFDGEVGFRSISVGSYIQPNVVIAHMIDRSTLKVEFSIPEKYAGTYRPGSKITFTTEGNSKTHTGKIYAVNPKLDPKTHTITLRALYQNAALELNPGMFARVRIESDKAEKSLIIPTEAVIPELNGKSVWVVRGGRAVSVPIETGIRTGDKIEVLTGLTPTDSVIVKGVMQVNEGTPIRVNP